MKDRAQMAKRVLSVQKQLHRIEELKFAQLQKRLANLEREQLELSQALSEDEALHGLFIDMTVRRLMALKQESARLAPEYQAQARKLVEHTGRVKMAERLADELALDVRRAGERAELEKILELSISAGNASLKQDR
jgi:hypothetical protein